MYHFPINTINIVAMKLLSLLLLIAQLSFAQCTYDNPKPFPSNLSILSGETLCIDTHTVTPWTSIAVYDGGIISIRNSSRFRIQGSLTVFPGGKVYVEDCDSKLEVNGTYNGGYNTCEIDYYCPDCSSIPFELVSGSKIWDEYCCVAPLPVELASFTVDVQQDQNIIGWTTLSEINASHYIVDRSEDGVIWHQIRTMPATNSQTISGYYFADTAEATCFYRLTQVDLDGSSTTYDIIVAQRTDNSIIETYEWGNILIILYEDGTTKKILK